MGKSHCYKYTLALLNIFIFMYGTLIVLIIIVGVADGAGHCTKDDAACEFYLTVNARMTMWRGYGERVYLNETDCKPYIFNSNATLKLDEILLVDGSGYDRVLTVVNGTMPGPALVMYVDQKITVHVKNELYIENVAIHWHGLTMKGTPWMDGADFVTQCPILPGQTFTYEFVADRTGTHYYHAHSGGKMSMGLFGPMIVKDRETVQYREHIMTIQDYNNYQTNQKHLAHVEYGIVFSDGTPFLGHARPDGSFTTIADVTSSLINGRGRFYDNNGTQLTCTPLTVFEVQQGQAYRFRLINAAFAYQSIVHVDGHKLSVMSLDGHNTEPVNVDKIMSHSGERVDFILTANRTVGNYWIRMESVVPGRFPAYAILRYVGAHDEEPHTMAIECTNLRPCTYLNCPFTSKPSMTCINADEMKSANTMSTAPSANSGGRFRELFLNFGFTLINGDIRAHVNGASFEKPTVSALTQPDQINNKCSEERGCGIEKACRCIDSIDIQLGDVIQLNLLNLGFFAVFHHPIHIHGYNFHVLKMGYRPTNASFAQLGPTQDVNCNTDNPFAICNNASWADPSWYGGNIPDIDLVRSPLKDTLVVPAGGYAVIRFVVDNPGLWFLHCHLEWDVNFLGMGILLNDSFMDIPPPSPGFPTCGSFTPRATMSPGAPTSNPISDTNTGNYTGTQTNDDHKFTRAEFWGTFGALLFVILLQFILAVLCLARSSGKFNICS